eukprot:gene4298-9171_t
MAVQEPVCRSVRRTTAPTGAPLAARRRYMWANLTRLNAFRAAHGMSTFSFRPHAGEAGELVHLWTDPRTD